MAYRKYSSLRPRMVVHCRNVACREHVGIGYGLERVADAHETIRVAGKPGFAKPRGATCLRDPDDLIESDRSTLPTAHATTLDGDHFVIQMQFDAPLFQHTRENPADRWIVCRQQRTGRDQHATQPFRILPCFEQ